MYLGVGESNHADHEDKRAEQRYWNKVARMLKLISDRIGCEEQLMCQRFVAFQHKVAVAVVRIKCLISPAEYTATHDPLGHLITQSPGGSRAPTGRFLNCMCHRLVRPISDERSDKRTVAIRDMPSPYTTDSTNSAIDKMHPNMLTRFTGPNRFALTAPPPVVRIEPW